MKKIIFRQEVIDTYLSNKSIEKTAALFNCGASTLHRFLNKIGIDTKTYRSDVIGLVFYSLTILSDCEKTRPRKVVAKCECGQVKQFYLENITKGLTKSCGCAKIKIEKQATLKIINPLKGHQLKKIRWGIIQRCYNKKSISYRHYGARGITVCDEWLRNSEAFVKWGIANGWEPELEIDRQQNNGNYEPSNCRFVTPHQNSRNRRSNIYVTYNQKTMVLKDWALELGIKYKLLHKHITYKGYSFEQAIKKQLKNVNAA